MTSSDGDLADSQVRPASLQVLQILCSESQAEHTAPQGLSVQVSHQLCVISAQHSQG